VLGDGAEVLTDSDDAEMFDDEPDKEENDDEALEPIAATEKRGDDEGMKDEPKSEKGKENEKIDISSKTQGTNPESVGQKGESTAAK